MKMVYNNKCFFLTLELPKRFFHFWLLRDATDDFLNKKRYYVYQMVFKVYRQIGGSSSDKYSGGSDNW